MSNKRRLKILRADPRLIVDCLNGLPDEFVSLSAEQLGLPADVEVLSVHANWERRSVDLLLLHPSFPEVPDGYEVPAIPEFAGLKCFKRKSIKETHDDSWRERPPLL